MKGKRNRKPGAQRASSRKINYELEGNTPFNEREPYDPTDQGYDEAAHTGSRYGVVEGHGGVFGTSGGGTFGAGFQVESRAGSPRSDWRNEIDENVGFAPAGGPHRGKGPRGYRRADDRILDDLHHRLERDGELDARDIEMEIRSGEATLRGSVETMEMRWRAERIAQSINGIAHVTNDLRVRRR